MDRNETSPAKICAKDQNGSLTAKRDSVNTNADSEAGSQLTQEDSKEKSCSGYFDSYVDVAVHELMIKDKPRTLAYKEFIDNNQHLFRDKIVLDVGAGTGILSCFAAKAGAKRVYAVEASGMADVCESIVYQNGLEDQIVVIHKAVEDVELDCNSVDVILSEWMGFYLFHESMLDSVLYARDKWLSDDGVVLPSRASLHLAPVSMKDYHNEHFGFWKNVYGLDFSPMIPLSLEKFFNQPVIEIVQPDQLVSASQVVLDVDLKTVTLDQIQSVSKNFDFRMEKTGSLHGFVSWFDVTFEDANNTSGSNLVLSTSPLVEATHWKQTVFFLPTPLLVDIGDSIPCNLTLSQDGQNKRHYNICIEVPDYIIEGEGQTDESINITADDIDNPEQHDIPCNCGASRCKIIKSIVEKYDDEQTELQNDNVVTVTSEEMGEDSELDASDSTT